MATVRLHFAFVPFAHLHHFPRDILTYWAVSAPEPKPKKNKELKYDFPAETEVKFAAPSWQKAG